MFEFFLLLHVGGAIAGMGPAFGFSVMGPMAARLGGPQALGIMKAMHKISKAIVFPMSVLQGITGAVLISQGGWDQDFGAHWWLWVSIILWLALLLISFFVQMPTVGKMIEKAESGDVGELPDLGKKTAAFGGTMTLLLVVIIVLMVLRPGG